MNKKATSRFILTCAVGALLTLSAGCDFMAAKDAVDNLDVIIELEPVNTFAVGQVIDASTGDLITEDVQITFDGPDKGVLTDAYSDPLAATIARQGFFSFGVQNAVIPSESDPVQITVTATAPGYYPSGQNVEIREVGADHAFALYLLPNDPNRQPAGTSHTAEVVGETGEDGTLEQAASVSMPGADGQTTLTLPVGIQFVDESGKPVEGTVTARVSRYDVSSTELLLALQAASNASAAGKSGRYAFAETSMDKFKALVNAGIFIQGADGQGYDTEMDRAQFARISALLAGLDAQVNTPISTFTDVPVNDFYAAFLNLQEGIFTQQGIWATFNEQSEATLTASHLGLMAILQQLQTTKDGLQLDIKGLNGPVDILVSGDGWARQYIAAANKSGLFTLHGMPIGEGGTLTLRSGGLEEVFDIADFSTGTQTVDFSGGPAAEDVTFDIQMNCTVKLKPPFNATLIFRPAGGRGAFQMTGQPTWKTDELGRVTGGTLTIPNLVNGETYRFVLYVPEANETRTQDITVTGTNMVYHAEVPGDLCIR